MFLGIVESVVRRVYRVGLGLRDSRDSLGSQDNLEYLVILVNRVILASLDGQAGVVGLVFRDILVKAVIPERLDTQAFRVGLVKVDGRGGVVFLVIQVNRDGPGIQESVVRRGNPVIVVYLDLVASVGILVGRDIVVSPDTVGNLEQVDIPVIVESLDTPVSVGSQGLQGGLDIQDGPDTLVLVVNLV